MSSSKIKLFDGKQVRHIWDEEAEKWWFSVVDVCAVLTDSSYQAARNYWKWLKNKLNAEGSELVSSTNQLRLQLAQGRFWGEYVTSSDAPRLR